MSSLFAEDDLPPPTRKIDPTADAFLRPASEVVVEPTLPPPPANREDLLVQMRGLREVKVHDIELIDREIARLSVE